MIRSQPMHSNVKITLRFVGSGLHLEKYTYAMEGQLSDVMVVQQHCGGNTVTLYKDKVKPKGTPCKFYHHKQMNIFVLVSDI